MMTAVWMRARAEMRARRRAGVALALLIGIGGGAVIATAAGARRTSSAFPRLIDSAHSSHAIVAAAEGTKGYGIDEIMALPEVAAAREARLYLMMTGDLDRCDDGQCLSVGIAYGPPRGGVVDEGKVVRGRRPNPSDPSEAALTVIGDDVSPLVVGDQVPLAGVPFDEPFFRPFHEAAERDPLTLKIVGVIALPRDFPPQLGDETIHLILTPAFLARYDVPAFGVGKSVAVRFKTASDLAVFRQRVVRDQREDVFVFDRVSHSANVAHSMDLQALALWLLAGFAGVALVIIVSQLIARELGETAADDRVLVALGMSRSELMLAAVLRIGGIVALGAAFASMIAFGLSVLTPIGLARVAEPIPGATFDAAAIGLGAAGIVVGAIVMSLWPAFRGATLAASRIQQRPMRISRVARSAAKANIGAASTVGIRMALEPGSGATSVPVRSTIATVVIGIGALVASLCFGSSLHHLVDTPRLYGVPWDLSIESDSIDFSASLDKVRAIPGVRGISIGPGFDLNLVVGDEEVEALAFDPVDGRVVPPILEGRGPSPEAQMLEVVLGTATLRRLNRDIGDRLSFTVADVGEFEATIVGRGVIPTESDVSAIGDAAWFSSRAILRAAHQTDAPLNRIYLSLDAGVEPRTVTDAVAKGFGVDAEDLYVPPVGTPADLVSFGRVRNLPLVVAGLLALIAAGALAHTLITAIRRRRRDLAVLKALGFSRAQARSTVAVQATVTTLAGAVMAIPGGIIAGRWAWTTFAERQGVIVQTVLPGLAIAAALPAALLLANLIAALPARVAARTSPAVVLRSE
jgi:ABC-type antimicrobial peptide transport system permease subunit